MSALNMTVKHGQPWEVARANFARAIGEAEAKYGAYIKRVEWSDDRTSARLSGSGFDVELRVDPEAVRASGKVPFFFRLFEPQVRKLVEEALGSP